MYATVTEFELTFGEQEAIDLTNLDNPTASAIDIAVLEHAISLASAEIDTYLRAAGYTLPLSEIPSALAGKCLDIARYKLDRNATREEVRQRYLDAIFWCKDLAKGTASLGVSSTSGVEALTAMPQFFSSDRTFTRDSLWDY